MRVIERKVLLIKLPVLLIRLQSPHTTALLRKTPKSKIHVSRFLVQLILHFEHTASNHIAGLFYRAQVTVLTCHLSFSAEIISRA